MFATGLAFLAGILTAALAPQPFDPLWVAVLPLILLLLGIAPPPRQAHRLLLWALAGALYASGWNHWRQQHRLEEGLNDRRVVAVGEVKSIPRLIERKPDFGPGRPDQRFEFLLHRLEDESGNPIPTRARLLRLSWRAAPPTLRPGQVWRLPLRLRQPHGYLNPGAFDYERWLWQRGIDATGWVRKEPAAERLEEGGWSLAAWRDRIVQRLRELCSGCRNTGLIEALSVGYRGNLPRKQRDLLRQTGTAHLVALSGLHIGIVAFGFHWLGRWLWRLGFWRTGLSRRSLSWIAALAGGFGYALLSGLAIPALRAVIMLALLTLGFLIGRRSRLLDVLGVTVILVLLIDPLSVLSASFWLSFSALCVIAFGLWRWPALACGDEPKPGWKERAGQGLRIQALFSLLFLPLGLAVFGEIHPASLFANLLAVPLVSLLIVPFNFLLLVLAGLPGDWLQPAYRLLDRLLDGLMTYLGALRDAGLAAWPMVTPPGWLLWALLLGLLAVLMPRGMLRGRAAWLLLPLPLLWPQWNRSAEIPPGTFVAEVLDVGMGTSLLIRTREHSLIYDFGPGRRQGYSLGEWAVRPLLHQRGIREPDRIVLSHEDQDHVGGFLALSGRWPDAVVDTGTQRETRAKFPERSAWRDCHRQPAWRWDGVEFRYLSTPVTAPDERSENDRSCVLRVRSARGASLLVPGDIERGQEIRLLAQDRQDLRADVLIVPHHGSRSSSTGAFIDAVAARDAVFTTGFLNRWRFPRESVVERYRNSGARLWNTAEEGALRIFCAESCRLRSLWRERPRLWR